MVPCVLIHEGKGKADQSCREFPSISHNYAFAKRPKHKTGDKDRTYKTLHAQPSGFPPFLSVEPSTKHNDGMEALS